MHATGAYIEFACSDLTFSWASTYIIKKVIPIYDVASETSFIVLLYIHTLTSLVTIRACTAIQGSVFIPANITIGI